MRLLKVEHLRKSYREASGELLILQDVNLEVNSGETVAITGESGSGKSTLLHLLGMLDNPDAGEIFYSGKPVRITDKSINSFRNQTVGFVFQFHYLFKGMSALENIEVATMLSATQIEDELLEKEWNDKDVPKKKEYTDEGAPNGLGRIARGQPDMDAGEPYNEEYMKESFELFKEAIKEDDDDDEVIV